MTTYKLDELAEKAGVAARTVRFYVQRGLLPAPDFRGKDTTYGPDHLVRLRAIKRLQEAHLPLEEIQARLAAATPAERERLANQPVTLEVDLPPVGRRRQRTGESVSAAAPETWRRITLAPGLELHVRADAPASTHRLAAGIQSRTATQPDEE